MIGTHEYLQATRRVHDDGVKVLCASLGQAHPCNLRWLGVGAHLKHRHLCTELLKLLT